MRLLSDAELKRLRPAETHAFPGPVPTQIVSSDEYFPTPQSRAQREVEARMKALGAELARKHGITRRQFFATAGGMAAAFVAMNEVYGPLFDASRAEAADKERADARAKALSGEFVMDTHTHFLRDDTKILTFVRQREAVGKAGWNPALVDKPQTIEDLKFNNYFKEIFLDSDTKVALLSSAPSEVPEDWFLTNDMMADARRKVNAKLGSRRLMSHAIVTPGYPGWMEEVDRAISQLKPDSFKGYTIGDNTNKQLSKHPWRMDDEKLLYPFYEKIAKAGLVNVCVHKGLYPYSTTKSFPDLVQYADVRDVGKAAKDWPALNFIIYHGGYRLHPGDSPEQALKDFEKTGRVEWVTDLAEIPGKYGVTNVYADTGQLFAHTTVSQPRLAAAMMGTLAKGLGHDHIIWGTDCIWTGAPQWQIEALRRLEIPDDMQKKYGYRPLGPADGPVKRAIFGANVARLYGYDRSAELSRPDRLIAMKEEYDRRGGQRSNLRYGYVIAS
ncbi:MAG TPA: amidohydrolase family protein [Candidatus Bathyarchaeia archaeon]|nr:amidohydrolase family protein [Candidatus Bathyarchaeia archaeon]